MWPLTICIALHLAEPRAMLSMSIRPQFKTVRKGTAWLPSGCHPVGMTRKHKSDKKGSADRTRLSVKKDMMKPRMARSARIAERKLDTTRIPEHPTVSMLGTVDNIIIPRENQPEKAQIGVDGADQRFRNLRIENTLIDEHGDEVKLKKGELVEVTITAEPKTPTAAPSQDSEPIRRKTVGSALGHHNS